MKIRVIAIVLFLANALGTPVLAQQDHTSADAVIIHAKIYTVNLRQPWAEAVAIRDGKIIAVGSDREIAAYRGPSTKVMDAKDHMVLPGFEDTHVHFMGGSARLREVSLDDAKTVGDFQKMIKDYATTHPDYSGSRAWVGTTTSSGRVDYLIRNLWSERVTTPRSA